MARKRRDKDEVSEDTKAGKRSKGKQASQEPDPEEAAQAPRSRRGRKLFFLLALAGTATYLVRRSQRKAELDEGIWHEAPAPPGQASAATGSAASGTPASPPTTA
jgi:hypothetical protein